MTIAVRNLLWIGIAVAIVVLFGETSTIKIVGAAIAFGLTGSFILSENTVSEAWQVSLFFVMLIATIICLFTVPPIGHMMLVGVIACSCGSVVSDRLYKRYRKP
jgi:hypothetical protein